ncbi:MAG: hypothetical protein ACRC5T_01665 [Cetobacterium sp.]
MKTQILRIRIEPELKQRIKEKISDGKISEYVRLLILNNLNN